jgi:Rrf2 family protein
MTVIFSKRCELALQATLFLATKEQGEAANASEISERLRVPKEFVSKVLQALTLSGIVGSRKGKNGGFFLGRPAEEIHLIDIVKVIDGTETFEKCVLGFLDCSPEHPCPVHYQWGALRTQAYEMLSASTLEELKSSAIEKISSI